jgi:plasmid stabilization system protein ParE
LIYHPLFQSDLERAARYYAKNGGQKLAEDFIDEIEQALFRLSTNPLDCSIVFNNVRRLRLRRFKAYAIRYSFDEAAQTLFVGSLVHGARDPSTDQDRFP